MAVVLHACSCLTALATGLPAAEEEAFRAALERVAAAVVRVEPAGGSAALLGGDAARGPAPGSPATGLVVDPAGWVVTTEFTVPTDASLAVVIRPDARRAAARVIGRDVPRGLVLLKTDPLDDPDSLPPLEPVARADLAVGQWALAVGRGWGAGPPPPPRRGGPGGEPAPGRGGGAEACRPTLPSRRPITAARSSTSMAASSAYSRRCPPTPRA